MDKSIIIAAGLGSRLRPLTNDLPKSLLKIGNVSIIDTQIKKYKENNINNINIIVGYKKEKFKKRKEKLFINKNYNNNNSLESLFYANKILTGNCYISYSDIIYKKNVLSELKKSKHDITLVIDKDWKKSYVGRKFHPISEAEKATINKHGEVIKIGKSIVSKNKKLYEFIGLFKLNNTGCEIFKKFYSIAKKEHINKKFFNAKKFSKAYITDFFSYLIKKNIKINTIIVKNNWMEIDTFEDYTKAQNFFIK